MIVKISLSNNVKILKVNTYASGQISELVLDIPFYAQHASVCSVSSHKEPDTSITNHYSRIRIGQRGHFQLLKGE